jgi:hypothetical protein
LSNSPKQHVDTERARPAIRRAREQEPVHPELHEEELSPWQIPTNLVAPPARDGYVQRWVRTSLRGEDDPSNIARSMQQGWAPRSPETVPGKTFVPTLRHGEHAGAIGVAGLILMERPVALDQRYKAGVRARTDMLTQAVTQRLADQENPRMPLSVQMRTQVERGRRPRVAPDADLDDDN